MKNNIAKTAKVSPKAHLDGVTVGENVVIEDGVVIGSGCEVDSLAWIRSGVHIGKDNYFGPASVIGGMLSHFDTVANEPKEHDGRLGKVVIGDKNLFFDNCYVRLPMKEQTTIGNDVMVDRTVYIGDNVTVDNSVRLLMGTRLMGNNHLHERSYMSYVTVAEGCDYGRFAFSPSIMKVNSHVPPFCLSVYRFSLNFVNTKGMRRSTEFGDDDVRLVRSFYGKMKHKGELRKLYQEMLSRESSLKPVEKEILNFIRDRYNDSRGFLNE